MKSILYILLLGVVCISVSAQHDTLKGANGTIFKLRTLGERNYRPFSCLNRPVLERTSKNFARAFKQAWYDNPDTVNFFYDYLYHNNFDQVLNYINEIHTIPIDKTNIIKVMTAFVKAVPFS